MSQSRQSRNSQAIDRLVQQASKDVKFFHDLIWNTEKALDSLDYLTRQEKASILAINPENLVVGLATGTLIDPGIVATCGATCGGSCGGSCGVSCSSTCAASCTASCSATGGMPSEWNEVINPAESFTAETLATQIKKQLGNNYSRYSRG